MGAEVLFPSSQEASEEKLSLVKLFDPFSVTKQAFQRLKNSSNTMELGSDHFNQMHRTNHSQRKI